MHAVALLALLIAPARAGIDLHWGPALEQALPQVQGPGREVAGRFDGAVLRGLEVRINEIEVLAHLGVRDLDALRRFRRRSSVAPGVPAEHLADLERSLRILSPVIARLEARGVRLDDRALASTDLAPPLSQALAAEARDSERRAKRLASRYGDAGAPLDQAYADSKETDALLHNRYPFISNGTLDGLARVYDSTRTKELAARRARAASPLLAMASAEDRTTMRDAVAEPKPKSIYQRIVDALAWILK